MMMKKYDASTLALPGQVSVHIGAPAQQQQVDAQTMAAYQQQIAHQQTYIQQLQQQQYDQRLLISDEVPTEKNNKWKYGTQMEKEGTLGFRFAFMPYREPGDINWGQYIRWWFLLLLMSIIQATVMARAASGLSSSVPALNSLILATVYMGTTVFALSWRQAFGLRLHTHQSVVVAETWHQHLGFVNMLIVLFWNSVGSAISGLFQRPGLLNCAAVPGAPYPAAPGVSFWGAVGIDAPLGVLVTYAYLHNIPLMFHGMVGKLLPSEKHNDRLGLHNVAFLFGLALFIGTFVGFPSGIWAMGNSVIYIGGAITLGASTPFEGAWVIPILLPFLYGPIAFGIHLLTFNVGALSKEDFLAEEEEQGAVMETPSAPEVPGTVEPAKVSIASRMYDNKKKK